MKSKYYISCHRVMFCFTSYLLPRMAMLEKDGVTDSMKYMTIEKELSHDDNGQTPIINRRRSKCSIINQLKL